MGALIVGSFATLAALETGAHAHAQAAILASVVEADLAKLSDTNYDLANPAYPLAQALVTGTDSRAELAQNVADLARTGFDATNVGVVAKQVNVALAAYDDIATYASNAPAGTATALSQGEFIIGATALANHNDAALSAAADGVANEVARLRTAADKAGRRASVGLAGRSVVLLVLVATLTFWDSRRRRRGAAVEADLRGRARFEAMVKHASDLTVVTDPGGEVTYVSPSVTAMLGYLPELFDAAMETKIVHPDDIMVPHRLRIESGGGGIGGPEDIRLQHADGSWKTVSIRADNLNAVPEVRGTLWTLRDVTDRRRLEAELQRQAFEDSLTGLPNRALFRDRLNHAVARGKRESRSVAVLLADLDGFKTVNDSLGHDAGDAVLVEFAGRLGGCLRPSDTVARIGGDEFTVLLEDLDDRSMAGEVARRIEDIVLRPVVVGGTEIRLGVSIGIAYSTPGVESGQELLRNADMAMYSAKSAGKGCWAAFEPAMFARADRDLHLALELEGIIERGELEVYYQPTYHLATGGLEGAEALVRWNHPVRGLVPPLEFIPAAEQSGQIVAIGRWVLEQACRQAAEWHRTWPGPPLTIGVNLSGRQLADEHIVADVAAALAASGLDPESLVLEITESVLMRDVDVVTRKLNELKALKVRLAIDDFGTGYSSLAYLRQFPVDILKIDRAFVEGASSGAPGGEALVRAIIDLGTSLHLTTIAEGIERQVQADTLLALGCAFGQGYLFARPMPAADFGRILGTARSTAAATA